MTESQRIKMLDVFFKLAIAAAVAGAFAEHDEMMRQMARLAK